MGHEHDREPFLGPQIAQHAPEFLARERIECCKGLIEQQQFGLVDERAADRCALLHATGEFPRELVFIALQSHGLQQAARARFVLATFLLQGRAIRFDNLQRQHQIIHRGSPGQQRRRLEGHADDLERATDFASVDQHIAPGRRLEPRNQLHERRFSTTGGPDDRHKLAFANRQRDILDCIAAGVVVGKIDLVKIHQDACLRGGA